MRRISALIVLAVLLSPGCKRKGIPVADPAPSLPPAVWDAKSTPVVEALMKASGGEHWAEVKRVEFTFFVDQKIEGKKDVSEMIAKHNWDLAAGTDTVTWNGKTVTVKLANPNESADTRAAYQRWANDTLWLIAPLKLRDGGVTVTYLREEEEDEKKYAVLRVTFPGGGLTPGDQFDFYVDPDTHLLHQWVYIPKEGQKMEASWFQYRKYDNLTLVTDHVMGDKHIFFDAVYVNQKGPADLQGEK